MEIIKLYKREIKVYKWIRAFEYLIIAFLVFVPMSDLLTTYMFDYSLFIFYGIAIGWFGFLVRDCNHHIADLKSRIKEIEEWES